MMMQSLDPLLVSFLIAFVSTFVTEITSNTACANILVRSSHDDSDDTMMLCPGADPVQDVTLTVHQPAVPHDDLCGRFGSVQNFQYDYCISGLC